MSAWVNSLTFNIPSRFTHLFFGGGDTCVYSRMRVVCFSVSHVVCSYFLAPSEKSTGMAKEHL